MNIEFYIRHYPWVQRRLGARVFGWWISAQHIRAQDLAETLHVSLRRAEHLRAGHYDPSPLELASLDDDQLVSFFTTLRRAVIAARRHGGA